MFTATMFLKSRNFLKGPPFARKVSGAWRHDCIITACQEESRGKLDKDATRGSWPYY